MRGLPLFAALLSFAACAFRPRTDRLVRPSNYLFDLPARKAELESHARPLDWNELLDAGSGAYFMGEDHYNASIKRELAARMDDFRRAGITCLGVEVPYLLQPEIDRFTRNLANEAAAQSLQAKLDENRIIASRGMFKLIAAAARAGVAVRAIDQSFAGGRAAFQGLKAQNEFMAARIDEKLTEEPSAKMLVLLGYGHLEDATQTRLLAARGRRTRRYIFLTSGLEAHPLGFGGDCIDDPAHYEYYAALEKTAFRDKSLFFPQASFDGYIIVPQILKEVPLPRDRGPASLCVSEEAPTYR